MLGDIELVGQPFSLSRTPSEIRSAAAERGEQTDEDRGLAAPQGDLKERVYEKEERLW